jgi:cytochrome b5
MKIRSFLVVVLLCSLVTSSVGFMPVQGVHASTRDVSASLSGGGSKRFTLAELASHNSKKSLYISIKGKVYDVTKFIDEHPGGEEVLLDEAGRDATEAFEDVGHSDDVHEVLKGFEIGEITVEKEARP